MLPRFSIVKQRTAAIDTVLLSVSWGTLVLGFTVSKRPLEIDFEDELYPHQRGRNTIAIIVLVFMHAIVAYLLLTNKVAHPTKMGADETKVVFFDTAKKETDKPKLPKSQPEKRAQHQPNQPKAITTPKPAVESIPSDSPVAAQPVDDTMARLAAARARRQALEDDAARDNQEQVARQGPSAEDAAMARIKANIAAANYNRNGGGGLFTIVFQGVQTGKFTFRGWNTNAKDIVPQSYEVDAGVGGDVQLAMVRKMIELIRKRYPGDFPWESHRSGEVITMSARPADNAALETFLLREVFDKKQN